MTRTTQTSIKIGLKPFILGIPALKINLSCPDSRSASILGSTRLADPSQVRDARPYTGLYKCFFLKPNLYLWVWPTSYNRIKISYTYTKELPPEWCPSNLYTYTESHLQIQNRTFTFTIQSAEPTCSEPQLVCWPSYRRKLSDIFSCTYTD